MSNEKLSRRNIVAAGAWSVPVVALAAATPAAAASTGQPQVNLWTQSRNPNEVIDFNSVENTPVYQGARPLTFTVTYGNLGPAPMPPGALVDFALPLAAVWGGISIDSVTSNYSLNYLGRDEVEVPSEPDQADLTRAIWSYTVEQAIPAGGKFDVVFRVPLNDTVSESTDYWKVRTRSTINIGAADVVDAVPDNNQDYSDTNVHYNHRMYVDLASTVALPADPTGTYINDPYYSGPGRRTFDATFTNNGTEALPAGSEITMQLPFDTIWTTFDIDRNPSSIGLTSAGSETVSLGGDAVARRWIYTVSESVAAGGSFDITFGAWLTVDHTTASNNLRARAKTQFRVGSAMATDATNDSLGNSEFAYFNNQSAESQ